MDRHVSRRHDPQDKLSHYFLRRRLCQIGGIAHGSTEGRKGRHSGMTVMFFFTNEIIRKGVRPKKEEERVKVYLTVGRNETTFDVR